MITLRECYKVILSILETDKEGWFDFSNDYPESWYEIVKGIDRPGLWMLSKVANDYEKQSEDIYGMYVDHNVDATDDGIRIGDDRSLSHFVANFLFEQAHPFPSNTRNLSGADLILVFWYLNNGGFFDLAEHYGTKKKGYQVIAAIHGLETGYVTKMFKRYNHRTNRINADDAPLRLFTVMSNLPENAKLEVSTDYVASIDNGKGKGLPEYFTNKVYPFAKKYIKENKM